jgi:hypothetical protein
MVVWINRFLVVGVPLLLIAIPVFRNLPALYRWRMRRNIYRWYGELRFIENAVRRGEGDPVAQGERLDQIEKQLDRQRVPVAYAADLYNLRSHIRMVRDQLRGPQSSRTADKVPAHGMRPSAAEQP